MFFSPLTDETDEVDITRVAGGEVTFFFFGAGQAEFFLTEATLGMDSGWTIW